jgi:cyclopropane fatty-acyl-phospholipid synthase-like methyltransferase
MFAQSLSATTLSSGNNTRMADWLSSYQSKQATDWTLRQLNIQPYQHLLEVGYGSGRLLAEAARMLKIGFLAGIESSIPLYEQAYRRNKPFIRQQLVQLHLGELYELSYPAHYFHTVYSFGTHSSWKDTGLECLRLSSLLKTDGRLVLLSRHRKDQEARTVAEHLQETFYGTGLRNIHTEHRELASGNCLAVIGFKA